MEVQMKTTLCGPEGSYSPGRVADLPAKQANDLIAHGYAVAVGGRIPRSVNPVKATANHAGPAPGQGAAP